MTLPKAERFARLEAAAALARERSIPWDEARAERIARGVTLRLRSPLAAGLRGFAWVGVASVAILAFYLPAARAILGGASQQSPVSSNPESEYIGDDTASESHRPLGDGGLEASTQ
jgi:hypothetical protein